MLSGCFPSLGGGHQPFCRNSAISHLHAHSLGIQTPKSMSDSKVVKGVATQEVTEQRFQERGPLRGQGGGGESESKDRDEIMLSVAVGSLESQHRRA